MNWIPLQSEEALKDIINASFNKPQVIFKHSTRCSISSMAKSRLDRGESTEAADFHYLDLIAFRPLSNQVANLLHVQHESPQIILLKDGKCIYDESHNGILMDDILEQVAANA